MAASVEVTADSLVIRIEGADRLCALRNRLEIPLANVVSAGPAAQEAHSWWHGVRVGGTDLPGVISAGRFWSHGQLVFRDVHNPDKAIRIELRDERYARLVIEVADPEAEVCRITRAIARAPAAGDRRSLPAGPFVSAGQGTPVMRSV